MKFFRFGQTGIPVSNLGLKNRAIHVSHCGANLDRLLNRFLRIRTRLLAGQTGRLAWVGTRQAGGNSFTDRFELAAGKIKPIGWKFGDFRRSSILLRSDFKPLFGSGTNPLDFRRVLCVPEPRGNR